MAYREGEEEMVAELEDALLQGELGPDELNVRLGHVVVGGAEVHGLHLPEVAVHGLAVAERLGVDGDDEDIVQEVADPFTDLEALAEEAEQRVWTRERFVHRRDDHRPVVGGYLGQHLGQICKFRLRKDPISFAILAFRFHAKQKAFSFQKLGARPSFAAMVKVKVFSLCFVIYTYLSCCFNLTQNKEH